MLRRAGDDVALDALIQQVNGPASFALDPQVVTDQQLVSVNAALSTCGSLALLVGAPLGGIDVATAGSELWSSLMRRRS